MKLIKVKGSTSQIIDIFVRDSTTGAGKGNLSYTNMTAYCHRNTATSVSTLALTTMSLGSFTSGGFTTVSTSVPGLYSFCPPNTCFASGADSVNIVLQASGMVDLNIEVQLTDFNVESSTVNTINTTIANAVWTNGTRDLTDYKYTNIATHVWTNGTRDLTNYNTTVISQAVWTNATRDLTNYNTTEISQSIWQSLKSNYTTTGTFGYFLDAQVSTVGGGSLTTTDITNAVWGNATRSLTDNTTIASLVWTNVTRTITGKVDLNITEYNNIAVDIWSYGTRELTEYNIGAIVGGIWGEKSSNYTTPSDTFGYSFYSQLVDVGLTVWEYTNGNRTLTEATLIAQTVWNLGITSHTSAGTFGGFLQTLDDDIINGVWTTGSRTLTDYKYTNIATHVWTNGTRDLTNYSTTAISQAVWTNATRSLTDNTTIAVNVWTNSTRELTNQVDIKSTTIDLIVDRTWDEPKTSHTTANTFGYFLDTQVSTISSGGGASTTAIAAAVWQYSSRVLTEYNENIIASAVWNDTASNYASLDTFGYVINSVLDPLNIATEVWNNSTRTLSEYTTLSKFVWNQPKTSHTTANTFGYFLDTQVSTISSGGGASTTDIAQAVWEYNDRVLTDTVISIINSNVVAIKTKTDQFNFSSGKVSAYLSGTNTFNMTGNISGSVNSVITPDSNVAAIKAKTDQLNFIGTTVAAYTTNSSGGGPGTVSFVSNIVDFKP